MLHQAQVKDVVGATAFDNHGEKIGKVDQLLLDDRTGQPEFVAAHTGLLRRHEALIPVGDATLEGGRLLVPYSKDQVRDAPEVTVADGHLDGDAEARLLAYYGGPGHSGGGEHRAGDAGLVDDGAATGAGASVHASAAARRARGVDEESARERFGGTNWGAAFFGWLVAVGVAVLLSSVVGAVAGAIGASTDLEQSDLQREAGTVGLAAAIAIVVVLAVSYYCGGYVAGRMSRFDGARQGVAVWLIGTALTIVAVVLGAVFGDRYNVLDRVSLPRIPVPTDAATWGGIITAAVLVVATLLAAAAGGLAGRRYHGRVDHATYR